MSETEIKVPNIGDFKDVEVIEVLVSEGQTLKKNDPLITIESDKSSVEIPSNFDGKIKTLKIKVGDKVSEGDLILILESHQKHKKKFKKNQ
jgi:pyruvate dehydrogenase E2 component (dihydrolipoamide acetyltransferase)